MELEEIKNYSHKILKINITNKNNTAKSLYKQAALKITLETLDNEVIRFSKKINSDFIDHQHHNNDYFLMIDNIKGFSVIYAHFFMKDLYDYDEKDNNLFFSYDFNNLKDEYLTSENNGQYTVKHDGEKIKVQSILDKSVTGDKDPNYKAYTSIEDDTPSNKTEAGYFPLVSRYRNNHNYDAPLGSYVDNNGEVINTEIGQSTNPKWHKNNKPMPTWEIKIPRNEISDLIQPDTNEEIYPINVYINYQYLPTSTEYHQHFYGFEDTTTNCKSINIFDNENTDTINEHFPKSTYSIINAQNKADGRYTMTVDHSNILPIDFTNYNIYDDTCIWEKNLCGDYWVYKATETNYQNKGLFFDVELKAETSYVLKYYIWIPHDTDLTNDNCEVLVCYNNKNRQIDIGKLNEAFVTQDKILRKQWIYHEIPFTTVVKNNRIIIKGPTRPNDEVYFINMRIEEIIPYSPTLKYTTNALILTEESEYTSKPNGEQNCQDVPTATNTWKKKTNLSKIKPHKYVYVYLDNDFNIRYNEYSYEIIVNNTNTDTFSIADNGNVTFTQSNAFSFNADTDLLYNKTPKTIFTYGPNNSFTLHADDDNVNSVNRGYVECAITTDSEYNGIPIKNETFYLGKKDVENGTISYNNINFKRLPKTNNYYLRIDYYDPCYDKITHYYEKVTFEEEDIKIKAQIIPEEGTIHNIENNGEIYYIQNQEELPLEIDAKITTQNGFLTEGYCVLSIDDEIKQNTFVNGNGIADFFLDINDLKEEQIIKIEYYREANKIESIIYFTINMKEQYDIRPVVPIRFNILNNDITEQMSNTYSSLIARHKNDNNEWSSDNCLLFDIDISDENYSNYRITMTRQHYENNDWVIQNVKIDGNKTYKNVYEASTESIVIGDYYKIGDGFNKYTGNVIYTVTTDNIQGGNKYRPYSKSITVNWIRNK